MAHLLIVEGGELAGKSFIISQIYNFLETKYNTNKNTLNGCHWFNCDIGILGNPKADTYLSKLTDIADSLSDRNIIFEKFHISDMAYNIFYNKKEVNYDKLEQRLLKLGAKLILCQIDEDADLYKQRLQDRLNLYPHYKKIAKRPEDYIKLHQIYRRLVDKSSLPSLTIDSSHLPNDQIQHQILNWLNEK